MKRVLRFFFVITLILSPIMAFPWTEWKHPISELLIQRLLLDTNYVFCGSDAYWGSNVFGLFVFNRRTETWNNYSAITPLDFYTRRVKKIEKEGNFVYIKFGGVTLRFNRYDGDYEKATKKEVPQPKGIRLNIEGIIYRIYRDSVIIGDSPNVISYEPSQEQIPIPEGVSPNSPRLKNLSPIFSHPVVYMNKIYMPYDLGLAETSTYTEGVTAFDVTRKTFHFYPSRIFKGTVTGSFLYDSLIILPTARFAYEGNARPAAGFVTFCPADSSFSLWKELPLPDIPLAIFKVAQDEDEYWIGTDKGIFRIDKDTYTCTHYQITKGIIAEDNTKVYCGNFGWDSFTEIAELDKDEEVHLLGVLNMHCEVTPPKDIVGYIESQYIEEVTYIKDTHKSIAKFKPLKTGERMLVKVSSDLEANTLITLDTYSLKEYEYEYEVVEDVTTQQQKWYKVKVPTAWINMDNLIFHLGEVE